MYICETCRFRKKTNLSGGAKICRGAAGAGVRQGSASTAANWGGWCSTRRGFWDAGGLTQDAMPMKTGPCRAPAQEELIQELNLKSDRNRGKTTSIQQVSSQTERAGSWPKIGKKLHTETENFKSQPYIYSSILKELCTSHWLGSNVV